MDHNMDELGRLFLGDVRRRQTEGHLPPQRLSPRSRQDVSIDLTPEEFARMFGDKPAAKGQPAVMLQAVIAPHLNGRQSQCVHRYAQHIASENPDAGRVGLIELDGAQLRVSCFECSQEPSEAAPMEMGESRQIVEALREMNWDVRRWMLSITHPRTPEARVILRGIDHWTLLATCDHDGVVGAYRTLKGLREDHRPQVTIAVLDALEPSEAGGVFDKLASVCQQFLDWPVNQRIVVGDHPQATEQVVLHCDASHAAAAWEAVEQFIAGLAQDAIEKDESPQAHAPADKKQTVGEMVLPEMTESTSHIETEARPPIRSAVEVSQSPAKLPMESEVIDLPLSAASPNAMLEAILHHHNGQWAECTLCPPMCPDARLVVGRDRRVTLAAAASAGLANLASIAQAYHWLTENRVLIGMALPQFSIIAEKEPALRLFVDQSDLSAQALGPLLQNRNVIVQPYRRLRWGEKLGLLLEAA
jgi:hypothetical protein